MNKSDDIKELAEALSLAQGEMHGAEKDGTNPAFARGGVMLRYATLASVWESIRKPLSDHGLSIVQSPGSTEQGMMQITTILLHKSGQFIEDTFSIPAGSVVTAQSMGSAITYARRYTLMAICGIAPDDDDGNEATAQANTKTAAKSSAQTGRAANWRDDPKAAAAVTNAAQPQPRDEPLPSQDGDPITPAQRKAISARCEEWDIALPDMDSWTKGEARDFWRNMNNPNEAIREAPPATLTEDGTQLNPGKESTEVQRDAIRKLCRNHGYDVPENIETLTWDEALDEIEDMQKRAADRKASAA